MRPSIGRFLRLVSAVVSVLMFKGCKPAERPPVAPGVSVDLAYPVLLIGQADLEVRDSAEDLVAVQGASMLNLPERRILDSDGRLFEVVRCDLAPGSKPLWLDMGTSYRHFYLELRELPSPALSEIQALLLAEVTAPRSVLAGKPSAVEKIRSLRSVAEVIEASRESWSWGR